MTFDISYSNYYIIKLIIFYLICFFVFVKFRYDYNKLLQLRKQKEELSKADGFFKTLDSSSNRVFLNKEINFDKIYQKNIIKNIDNKDIYIKNINIMDYNLKKEWDDQR